MNITPTPRSDHPRAYQPWSEEEDTQLLALWHQGRFYREIAAALNRPRRAIRLRCGRLGLQRKKARVPHPDKPKAVKQWFQGRVKYSRERPSRRQVLVAQDLSFQLTMLRAHGRHLTRNRDAA